jgi:peptide/nickel transport system substrate-binding protein
MKNKLITAYSMNSINDTWDSDSSHVAANNTVYMVYEPLTFPSVEIDNAGVRYPAANDLMPRLAASWENLDNAKKWRIHLRKNVINQYGHELTADDVVWSWLRTYELRRVGRWRSRRVAGVFESSDIIQKDKYTIDFILNRPNEFFPQYLSFSTNVIVDSIEARKHINKDDPWAVKWLEKNPAGWGAFRLAEQGNNQIRLQANETYWAGQSPIEEIIQIGVQNRDEGLALLRNGEVNCLMNLYPEELQEFSSQSNIQTNLVRSNHSKLEFDYMAAPFDDLNVRQAIAYGLPYERIIEEAYMGFAQRSTSPILSVSSGYSNAYAPYETNIEKAKLLMAKSKYPEGISTELFIDPTNESIRFAEIAQSSLKEIGIELTISNLNWPEPLQNGRPPMWFHSDCGHALTEPIYDLCHDFDPPMGILGGLFIRNDNFVEKITAIKNASLSNKAHMYAEIQKDIIDFTPCVFIAENQTGWAIHKSVDPWIYTEHNLGLNATVWSTHRNQMNT